MVAHLALCLAALLHVLCWCQACKRCNGLPACQQGLCHATLVLGLQLSSGRVCVCCPRRLIHRSSTGGSSQSRSSSRYEAAAAGSPGTSPVRQLALSAQGVSPRFGTTPGSVYSTPTLALGQVGGMAGGRAEVSRGLVNGMLAHERRPSCMPWLAQACAFDDAALLPAVAACAACLRTAAAVRHQECKATEQLMPAAFVFSLCSQMGVTPGSALSSAVGSAIRDIGSAGHIGARDRGLSPPGMNVSPTLQLLPNLGAAAGLGEVRCRPWPWPTSARVRQTPTQQRQRPF